MEYLHGGNVFLASRELGIPVEKIIDFSASINPLGLPESVKDALRENINLLIHYPDTECTALREIISKIYNIGIKSIIIGNGSTELIYLIPKVLRPQRVLIPAPTFSEYERAINREYKLQNTEHRIQIKYLLLQEENDFKIDTDEFINAMQGCDMAFLCNPNNPTGQVTNKDRMLKISEEARKQRCYLIVDEAFMDFIPEQSILKYAEENPYLIVLRSMTKFYALTGLRIGYGVAHPETIKRLKEFQKPWSVNTLAQIAGIYALKDFEFREKSIAYINDQKRRIEKNLRELGIRFFPSDANFYLIKHEKAQRIIREFYRKGILLRDCSNFKGLDSSYMRISIRSERENQVLLKEFASSFSSTQAF